MTTDKTLQPRCECGLVACGLVWIPNKDRYQCGMCIQATYAYVTKLEAKAKALERIWKGEVWYWQDDEDDKLESLTCPILIEPMVLRSLLSRVAATVPMPLTQEAESTTAELRERLATVLRNMSLYCALRMLDAAGLRCGSMVELWRANVPPDMPNVLVQRWLAALTKPLGDNG